MRRGDHLLAISMFSGRQDLVNQGNGAEVIDTARLWAGFLQVKTDCFSYKVMKKLM